MIERTTSENDFFVEYRQDPIVPIFNPLKEIIKREFTDTIVYSEFEPHLVEWMVIRYKHANRDIDSNEFNDLTRKFSEVHDDLFDNSLFITAIKRITEKIGLVV